MSQLLKAIEDAIERYCIEELEPDEGDVVTDFAIVAGWVNFSNDEDGVFIISGEHTPGYTKRGLLSTGLDIMSDYDRRGEE